MSCVVALPVVVVLDITGLWLHFNDVLFLDYVVGKPSRNRWKSILQLPQSILMKRVQSEIITFDEALWLSRRFELFADCKTFWENLSTNSADILSTVSFIPTRLSCTSICTEFDLLSVIGDLSRLSHVTIDCMDADFDVLLELLKSCHSVISIYFRSCRIEVEYNLSIHALNVLNCFPEEILQLLDFIPEIAEFACDHSDYCTRIFEGLSQHSIRNLSCPNATANKNWFLAFPNLTSITASNVAHLAENVVNFESLQHIQLTSWEYRSGTLTVWQEGDIALLTELLRSPFIVIERLLVRSVPMECWVTALDKSGLRELEIDATDWRHYFEAFDVVTPLVCGAPLLEKVTLQEFLEASVKAAVKQLPATLKSLSFCYRESIEADLLEDLLRFRELEEFVLDCCLMDVTEMSSRELVRGLRNLPNLRKVGISYLLVAGVHSTTLHVGSYNFGLMLEIPTAWWQEVIIDGSLEVRGGSDGAKRSAIQRDFIAAALARQQYPFCLDVCNDIPLFAELVDKAVAVRELRVSFAAVDVGAIERMLQNWKHLESFNAERIHLNTKSHKLRFSLMEDEGGSSNGSVDFLMCSYAVLRYVEVRELHLDVAGAGGAVDAAVDVMVHLLPYLHTLYVSSRYQTAVTLMDFLLKLVPRHQKLRKLALDFPSQATESAQFRSTAKALINESSSLRHVILAGCDPEHYAECRRPRLKITILMTLIDLTNYHCIINLNCFAE